MGERRKVMGVTGCARARRAGRWAYRPAPGNRDSRPSAAGVRRDKRHARRAAYDGPDAQRHETPAWPGGTGGPVTGGKQGLGDMAVQAPLATAQEAVGRTDPGARIREGLASRLVR